jgi:hypothetical protein
VDVAVGSTVAVDVGGSVGSNSSVGASLPGMLHDERINTATINKQKNGKYFVRIIPLPKIGQAA